MAPARTRTTILVLVTVLSVSALFGVMGAGSASDMVGIAEFDPNEQNATQGEEVTVEMVLTVGDSYHTDAGMDRVELTAMYNDTALTVSDVQQGDWMEQGEETNVEMNVTEKEGELTVYQERVPSANGTTGSGTFAEVTFEVADDAEPGTYDLTYRDDSFAQMPNDHYYPVVTNTATLTVEQSLPEEAQEGVGPMFGVGVGIVLSMVSLATYIRWQREKKDD